MMAWTCNSDGEKLHIYTYIYICIYNICTYIYTHTHTHRIPSRRMSVAAVILTWIFEKPRTPNRGFEQTNSLSKFNDRCPPPHTPLLHCAHNVFGSVGRAGATPWKRCRPLLLSWLSPPSSTCTVGSATRSPNR